MHANPASQPVAHAQIGDRAKLLALVAHVYDIPARDLTAGGRGSVAVAHARRIAIYLMRTVLELSYGDIGAAFGRHRTTMHDAVQRVEDRRDDPELDQTLNWLESVLRPTLETGR